MYKTNTTYKRLFRSRYNRRIAGVCGGLGEYFNIDPVWIRIFFVALFLAGGAAFIAYVILWLMMPLEPWDRIKVIYRNCP
ncbi:PspC domain-containing protein [Legionella maioricensis]|uniref:PspC domain-containing protein n=1 Tax=Legionella maioricensis TaxID=2896528 RepID=A0A9X2D0W5_9GAMM|nr:PspC domain-containing protein [Legionella maioricensis]MCL9684565.1 PspC domain-containing protein [Legionella maioricensis]MCL9687346.1 PspC domain-containing protein [Legionella maioricensis]